MEDLVYSLPDSKSSYAVKENFLREMSYRVDVDENVAHKQLIQVLIFLPSSRPVEEFDHVMKLFYDRGGARDKDIVFITAIKSHQNTRDFEVPTEHRIEYAATLNLAAGGNLEPSNEATLDKLGDCLVESYSFKRSRKARHTHENIQTKCEVTNENALREGRQVYQEEQNPLQQEVDNLTRERFQYKEEIVELNSKLQAGSAEVSKLKHEKEQLAFDIEERNNTIQQQEEEITQQKKEISRLKEENEDKDNRIRQQEEVMKQMLEKSSTSQRQRRAVTVTSPDTSEIITSRSINFTYQRGVLGWIWYWIFCCFCFCCWCFGKYLEKDKEKDVDVYAIEAMKRGMTESNYKIQRSYEKQLYLEPGTLKILMEDLSQTLKTQSTGECSESMMQNFDVLGHLEKKYRLSEENLHDLLSEVYRQGKKGRPSRSHVGEIQDSTHLLPPP